VYERNANRIKFDTKEVLEVIKSCMNAEDPVKRSIALLIASGCRPIELYQKSDFEIDPNRTKQ